MSTPHPTQNDQPGEGNVDVSYKERLDAAAEQVKTQGASTNSGSEGGVVNQVVEKVSQFVPAAGKILGQGQEPSKAQNADGNESKVQIPGPPERPNHDTQIEEFVRDQHLSKQDDGTLAGQ